MKMRLRESIKLLLNLFKQKNIYTHSKYSNLFMDI